MMKQAQIKVLNEELNTASWIQSSNIARRRLPQPRAVKQAKKVLAKYETTICRAAAKIDRQYKKLKNKARHAIYFGTEKQAMLAIRAALKFYMDHSSN